ncbi:MAG: M4 family metallopeptidase [Planctomycetota bacterium]
MNTRGLRKVTNISCFLLSQALFAGLVSAQQPTAVEIHRSTKTGLATFVSGANGGRIPVAIPAGRATGADPSDFLGQYGSSFGLTSPATQLTQVRSKTDSLTHTQTVYQQVHKRVPVFSGVLNVHQDSTGAFLAANGHYYPIPEKLNATPTISSAVAITHAQAQLVSANPVIEKAELVVVDPGWYGDPSIGPHLAYHVVLVDGKLRIREAFFIDAHDGKILDQWSMIHTSLFRAIFDASGIGSLDDLPGDLVRLEGDLPTGEPEENRAYNYAGDVYQYYANAFGRDSIDDTGLSIIASVNVDWDGCPNAFWNGFQAVFCPTIATDDVVAHELTHGVTEFTAGLIYQNQSGQLNESFSDVFGEIVDLFNGNVAQPGAPGGTPWPTNESGPGTDTPNNLRSSDPNVCSRSPGNVDGVRWLVSEDGTEFGGAIRDMWNPACYDDPPRANSSLMQCQVNDSGGVHSGSGVPNHAFAIITDGKTFNAQTVIGIGLIKSGAVWYRALTTYLTPSSDFEDAYEAFRQSALDLVGSFPNDPRTGLPSSSMFSVDDYEQVVAGLRAVEMDTPGRCGQNQSVLDPNDPDLCKPPVLIFFDSFEDGTNGWKVFSTGPAGPPTPYDWIQTDELPLGQKGTAWFCADPFFGDCFDIDESSIHSLFSPEIKLPSELIFPLLTFEHFFATETGFDGGNVKISVNDGPFHVVPTPAYVFNPANGTLLPESAGNTNPIAGETGFTGSSGVWGTSIVFLGGLVSGGETIRLRFDFGKDGCAGNIGWYVDDVWVIDCPLASDCNGNRIPDESDIALGPQRENIILHEHLISGAVIADANNNGFGVRSRAVPLNLLRTQTVRKITIWGGYRPFNGPPALEFPEDHVSVLIHRGDTGVPGEVIYAENNIRVERMITGEVHFGVDVWEHAYFFAYPLVIAPGSYFIEIFNSTPTTSDTFFWETAEYTGSVGFFTALQAPGVNWFQGGPFNLSMKILGEIIGSDCDDDGIPDECETDCNGNRIPDPCDIRDGTSLDANANGLPDECQCDARLFGDIAPDGGDGSVDMLDILCVIDGTSSQASCPLSDLAPCGGNGLVDVSDLIFILDAFAGAAGCCGE